MCGERLASLNFSSLSGQRITILGVIKDITIKAMKNGANMMSFNLVDGELKRGIVVFDVSTYIQNKINGCMGGVAAVTVDVKAYDKGEDGVSCVLYDVALSTEANIDDFIPSVKDIDTYVNLINNYLSYCSGTIYGKIAMYLIQNNWNEMSVLPAGRSQHHAIKGGLLMHTACVAMSCVSDYNTYKGVYGEEFINLPLLLSGALIHDIGKCCELEYDGMGGCEYNKKSVIESHTVSGIRLIEKAAAELGFANSDEVNELIHLVASHHDKLEWGAAVRPATTEAVLLARADEKDAMINKFCKKTREVEVGDSTVDWDGGQMNGYYHCMSADSARENVSILEYSGESEETT